VHITVVCPDTMAAFQYGLCGCFGNPFVCIITVACPCYTGGKVAETTGRSCALYSLLAVWFPCVTCCVRRDIRQSKNIDGSWLGDLCVHLWCQYCALCQEARETNAIGANIERAWNDDDATAAYQLLNFYAIFRLRTRFIFRRCVVLPLSSSLFGYKDKYNYRA